ncbi:hypothetical protein ACWEN6_13795 [Sphaerisporangium sp. NPDC004334]
MTDASGVTPLDPEVFTRCACTKSARCLAHDGPDIGDLQREVALARDKVVRAALRVMCGDYDDQEHAHSDAEAQYAAELLALAARSLVHAVEALPPDKQPVGWRDTPGT